MVTRCRMQTREKNLEWLSGRWTKGGFCEDIILIIFGAAKLVALAAISWKCSVTYYPPLPLQNTDRQPSEPTVVKAEQCPQMTIPRTPESLPIRVYTDCHKLEREKKINSQWPYSDRLRKYVSLFALPYFLSYRTISGGLYYSNM